MTLEEYLRPAGGGKREPGAFLPTSVNLKIKGQSERQPASIQDQKESSYSRRSPNNVLIREQKGQGCLRDREGDNFYWCR